MFPDGLKFRSDIPGIFSLGVEYSVMPQLRVMISYHLFFDKSADWEGAEELVDSNTYDIAFGLEYDITETFLVSAGYLHTSISLSDDYLGDMSYELSSNAFGVGARYTFNQNFTVDAGFLTVSYSDASKNIDFGIPFGSFQETYKKTSTVFSIGLGYHF